MDKLKFIWSAALIVGTLQVAVATWHEEYLLEDGQSVYGLEAGIVRLDMDRTRVRRDTGVTSPVSGAPSPASGAPTSASGAPTAEIAAPTSTTPTNTTQSNSSSAASSAPTTAAGAGTTLTAAPTAAPTATAGVTQTPLLGANGTGILRVNLTDLMPKVSDPIFPDDNFTDMFVETPERIKAEQNITNLTIDNHSFYNSTFIGNETFFEEHWRNISAGSPVTHAVLSNSHRRATTLQLSFGFPFYGNEVRNITVATGGFIYTGEHVHNWLAATQYIAPLMANFDTSRTDVSRVKLLDDGERFTAFWENVTLQEGATDAAFTFAVTLYKNGDIVFAYRTVPFDVQAIDDSQHPVKVGISDAYLNDNIMFYVRRKTIYEYHRVNLKEHAIGNRTLLRLTALPTCLQYRDCVSCLTHDTAFNCTWCPQIQKCSSGTDRNKQDWKVRNCEKTAVRSEPLCVQPAGTPSGDAGVKTAYDVDNANTNASHDTHVDTVGSSTMRPTAVAAAAVAASAEGAAAAGAGSGGAGGAVAACLVVALVAAIAWVLYAFKNPHTRSGQILIKYRPSQWSWKRGEARYTAATIHM